MDIFVPEYSKYGFQFVWEEGSTIKCTNRDGVIEIVANRAGLISLARHLLELSQESVPVGGHFHLDPSNALEDESLELVVARIPK